MILEFTWIEVFDWDKYVDSLFFGLSAWLSDGMED